MENASKALIIAGAILLAILIISLGIVVYNQAKQATDSVNMDQQSAETFNSKLSSYIGENKTATDVNDLKALVLSINTEQKNNEDYHFVTMTDYVTVTANGASTTWTDSGKYATTGSTYKITITDTDSDGYYDKIDVATVE